MQGWKLTVNDLRRHIRRRSQDAKIVIERVDKDGNIFDTRYVTKIGGSYRYGEDVLVIRCGPFARQPGETDPIREEDNVQT